MYKNDTTLLDIVGTVIDTIFEESSMKHPCIRSRHITQLLYCPYFMNRDVSFNKNPSMVEGYIKEFIVKVLAWLKKRGDSDDLILLSHVNLMEKLQQLHIFLQTHQPYQLYFGLNMYKTQGRKKSKGKKSKRTQTSKKMSKRSIKK
jgi:hypothetical protein